MTPTRTGWTLVSVVAGSLAVFAAAAFACTNLATLNLSQAWGKPGDALTVTGSSFALAKEGPTSPVALHWNGVDGPVLVEAAPDAAGNISAGVTVPDGQPGFYVLVATQRNAEGEDEYGTPARASFQILGAGGQPLAPQAPSEEMWIAQRRAPRVSTSATTSSPLVGLRAMSGEEWARTGLGLAVTWTAAVGAGFRSAAPAALPVTRDATITMTAATGPPAGAVPRNAAR